MTRILITGKNCDLSREAFSRAARLADAASLKLGRAAFHSGHQPDSAAGGSRRSDSERETPPRTSSEFPCALGPEPPQPWLGVDWDTWFELGMIVLIFAAIVAMMVLASL